MRTAFVVDVNVVIVANGRADHADHACVLSCLDALEEIKREGVIVLDNGLCILNEYKNHLSLAGQSGVGDAFMKWVWEHQAVADRCERVVLTPIGNAADEFAEFPDVPELRDFDRTDRKYVAVALASQRNPVVLNAVDRDWWNHRDALEHNGVICQFLCLQHMS
ncbi:MAG: hypothetical protein AABY45_10275 [Deltaproteobacteria bacterium]